MTPDRVFPIFFATWVVLGIASGLFYWKASLQAKRRLHPWFALGTAVLFVGFVSAMLWDVPFLLVVVIAVTFLIGFVNYKNISFCPRCGRSPKRSRTIALGCAS